MHWLCFMDKYICNIYIYIYIIYIYIYYLILFLIVHITMTFVCVLRVTCMALFLAIIVYIIIVIITTILFFFNTTSHWGRIQQLNSSGMVYPYPLITLGNPQVLFLFLFLYYFIFFCKLFFGHHR